MEFVYVIPRADLFRDCYPQGFRPFGERDAWRELEDLIAEKAFFVEREYAEKTPALKQIIPYSIAMVESQILLMRRLAKGGENRLHGKLSIGVGGHINPEDSGIRGAENPIVAGTRREIAEELDVKGSYEIHPVGLLNDDSNPVGAVHVGLVQTLVVQGTVDIREVDVLEGRLTTPGELVTQHEQGANFESWSARLVERLDEIIPRSASQILKA